MSNEFSVSKLWESETAHYLRVRAGVLLTVMILPALLINGEAVG